MKILVLVANCFTFLSGLVAGTAGCTHTLVSMFGHFWSQLNIGKYCLWDGGGDEMIVVRFGRSECF